MSACSRRAIQIFTSKHQTHDEMWLLQNSNLDVICFACVIETLDDETSLNVRKRKMVSEVLDLLTTNRLIWELFSKNNLILRHTCNVLLKLLQTKDKQLSSLLVEALGSLVQRVSDEHSVGLLDLLASAIKNANKYKKETLDQYICLLGKIIRNSKQMVNYLLENHRWIIEMIADNIEEVAENAAVSFWYVFTQIYKLANEIDFIGELSKRLLDKIFHVVGSTCLKDLQLNILAILNIFATKRYLRDIVIKHEDEEIAMSKKSVADIMKKMILSTNKEIQIGAVQCLIEFLRDLEGDRNEELVCFAETMIEKGLCEFLVELLSSSDSVLVASVCNCLLLFASCKKFFTAGHVIYGFEPMIQTLSTVVEKRTSFLAVPALALLLKLLTESKMSKTIAKEMKCIGKVLVNLSDVHEMNIQNLVILCSKELISRAPEDSVDFNAIEVLLENFGKALLKKSTSESVKSSVDQGAMDILLNTLDFASCLFSFMEKHNERHIKSVTESKDENHSSQLDRLGKQISHFADLYIIPGTVLLLPYVKDSRIFVSFFDLLSLLLKSIDGTIFAKKFCQTSFIRIASEIKSSLTKEAKSEFFATCLDNFLINLVKKLDFACAKSSLSGLLSKTLRFLKAPPNEWHLYFGSNSTNVDESILSPARAACLALLYISAKYGDPIWKDETTIQCISNYLLAGASPNDDTSNQSLVYLWSYARLRCQMNNRKILETDDIMLSLLERKEGQGMVFMDDGCFIRWVIGTCKSQKIIQSVLSNLFSAVTSYGTQNEMVTNMDNVIEILSPYSANLNFYTTCMDILSFEMEEVVEHAMRILSSLMENIDIKNIVTSLKGILNKKVLSIGCELGPSNIKAFLEIYRYLFAKEMEVSEVDVKFASNVCNVFVETPYPKVRIAALNFINLFLRRIQEKGNPCQANVLHKENFIKASVSLLPRALSFPGASIEMLSSASILLVSQLATLASLQNLTDVSLKPIEVNKQILILGLNRTNSILIKIACLKFWSTFFYFFQRSSSLLQHKGYPLQVSNEEVRTIVMYFQNLLLNEEIVIREMALISLTSSLERLGKVFPSLQSSWNIFLVDHFTQQLRDNFETEFCLKTLLCLLEHGASVQNFNALSSAVVRFLENNSPQRQEVEVLLLRILFFLIDLESCFSGDQKQIVNCYLHKLEDKVSGFVAGKPLEVVKIQDEFLLVNNVLFPQENENGPAFETVVKNIANYREKLSEL